MLSVFRKNFFRLSSPPYRSNKDNVNYHFNAKTKSPCFTSCLIKHQRSLPISKEVRRHKSKHVSCAFELLLVVRNQNRIKIFSTYNVQGESIKHVQICVVVHISFMMIGQPSMYVDIICRIHCSLRSGTDDN